MLNSKLLFYYIMCSEKTYQQLLNMEKAEVPSKSKGRDKRLRRPCFPLALLLCVS